MGQFLYALPDIPEADTVEEKLEYFGLYSRAEIGWYSSRLTIGVDDDILPCELEGADREATVDLVSLGGSPAFDRERQRWQVWHPREEPAKAMWLGWWAEDPPTPEDLRRRDIQGGYPITLGDHHTWFVPRLRTHDGEPGEGVSEDETEVLQALEDVAPHFYRLVDENREEPDPEQIQLMPPWAICRALRTNYRVDRAEIETLGLATSKSYAMLGIAIVDAPGYLEARGIGQDFTIN